MNRLWLRLTLAFIVVTQLSIIVVAVLASSRISGEFRRYVIVRDVTSLNDAAQTETILVNGTAVATAVQPGTVSANPPLFSAFILANAGGKIVYDPQGQRLNDTLNPSEQAGAVPINGPTGTSGVLGYALPAPAQADMLFRSPELDFVSQLNKTLIVAALLVSAIGTLIGLVISRMLVAPLASLADAAHAFAAHDWAYRVKVKGPIEIAAVAQAFNAMAGEINRAETLRRNMMADIAHELRTPLSVMQCNLRGLLDGVYALTQPEIATLYDETRLLNRLVDDLRELALADAGKLTLNLAPIQLDEALGSIVDAFAAVAENVQITLSRSDSLPALYADTDRLTQILRNLIVNALRHTASGAIRISAETDGSVVRISVADTGEGINPEDLPYVFDRFYRSDKSRSRANGGSGLGLAITRALVEAMHGTIGVESTPGQGSRFWFTLPAAG